MKVKSRFKVLLSKLQETYPRKTLCSFFAFETNTAENPYFSNSPPTPTPHSQSECEKKTHYWFEPYFNLVWANFLFVWGKVDFFATHF